MIYDVQIMNRLVIEFSKVRADIIENYERKKMRASGSLPKSLTIRAVKNKVAIIGNKYIEQLEYGRKPSASMPPLQAIYDWILEKRVFEGAYKEYQIRGLAYVIARKIQQEGYDRESYGGVGLVSEILTDKRIKDIIDLVGKDLMPIFAGEILTFFKK